MTTKILFFTDIHLRSSFPNHKSDPIYKSKGLLYIKRSLDWILEQVDELKPDLLIFGGDLIDSPKRIDFVSYNIAIDFFSEASEKLPVFAIVGNHDIQGGTDWSHSLYPLNGITGVTVVDRPTKVHPVYGEVLLLPYMKSMTKEAKEAISSSKSKIVFTHIGFEELKFSNGESFGPFKFEDFNSDYVVSGHYHVKTEFNKGRMRYPGSLLAKNFHDAGDYGFGCELISIQSNGDVEFDHIVNPYSPRYIKLDDSNLHLVEMYNSSDYDHFYKIKTSDPTGLQDKLDAVNLDKSEVLQITPEKVDFTLSDQEDRISESLSIDEAITSYVSEMATDSQNGTFLTSVGLELYQQADIVSSKRQRVAYSLKEIEVLSFMSADHNRITFGEGMIFVDGKNLDDGGSNGAGKSLILESIYWALFGKTIRVTDKAEDVCHNEVGRCVVNIRLSSNLDDEIIIQRYRSITGFGSGVKVFISRAVLPTRGKVDLIKIEDSQKLVDLGSGKVPRVRLEDPKGFSWLSKGMNQGATNELIQELLGIDPKLFKLTTLFSKRSTPLTKATEASRVGEFMSFLDLGTDESVVEARNEKKSLKELIASKEREAEQFELSKERDLLGCTKLIDSYIEQKASALKMGVTTAVTLNTIVSEMDLITEWLESKSSLDIGKLKLAYSEALGIKSGLYSELQRSGVFVGVAKKALDEFNKCFSSSLKVECPTCYSKVSMDSVAAVRLELEARLDVANVQYNKNKSRLARKVLKLGIQDKSDALDHETELQSAITTKRARLSALTTSSAALTSNRNQLMANIKQLESNIDTVQESILTLQASVYEGSKKEVELRKRLDAVEFWCKGFSRRGLPTFMLSKVLTFANERLNMYLNIVSSGKTKATFSTSERGVSLVCTRADGNRPYSTLSDGQQSCVDLAVQLALHDVQMLSLGGLGIMFFDEAVAHIDDQKAIKSIEMIKEKLDSVPLIFITTHRDSIIPDDATCITAVLKDGFTKYEVEYDDRSTN